ncbi:hypothetical protein AALC25_09095 [Lachnospiraceae bacterium 29-84]
MFHKQNKTHLRIILSLLFFLCLGILCALASFVFTQQKTRSMERLAHVQRVESERSLDTQKSIDQITLERYKSWSKNSDYSGTYTHMPFPKMICEDIDGISRIGDFETLEVYDASYIPYADQYVPDDVIAEFWEKKEQGVRIYGLTDEDGNIVATFEPREPEDLPSGMITYSKERPPLPACAGYSYTAGSERIVEPGTCSYGTNIYYLSGPDSCSLQVKFSQDKKGKSYLILKDRNTGTMVRLLNTETEDGWYGTIRLGPSIPGASYSIGIENASQDPITYRGMYSIANEREP